MDLNEPARRARGAMRVRLLALGGVVAVLAAGCGGSSTPTTTTKTQTAKKTVVSKPKTSTTAATSSSGVSHTVTSSASSTPTFASAGNCTQMAGVGEQFAKAMAAASSGGKYNLSTAVAAYKALADAAPSAIRPDLETLASAFTAYATAVGKAGFKPGEVPSATQIAAIEAASKQLSAAKLLSASKAIEAWAAKNCTA